MKVVRLKNMPGNPLKALRLSAGFTQTELTRSVGISMRTLNRYENGEHELEDLPIGLAKKIAAVLNVDLLKLIDRFVLDRSAIENDRLSLEGLGLYSTVSSFRKREVLLDRVKRYTSDADETIDSALKELVDLGYIEIVDTESAKNDQ